jgi:hypothetical protein
VAEDRVVARVVVAVADLVADRAMGALDPESEQGRVQDPDQRQDQGRMQGQDQARVKDRDPVQVTDPVTEQAMMVKALRTVQVLDRVKRMFNVS